MVGPRVDTCLYRYLLIQFFIRAFLLCILFPSPSYIIYLVVVGFEFWVALDCDFVDIIIHIPY